MKALLYVPMLLVGCASAGRDTAAVADAGDDIVGGRPDADLGGGGDDGGGVDADIPPPIDAAPLPDAPVGQMSVTLSQTNDTTLAVAKGIACASRNFFGIVTATRDNSWYRVFKLTDYGITGAFNVQRVTFWADYAVAGGSPTSQAATIKVGTYAGTVEADTLNTAQITTLATVPITIPDVNSEVSIPPPTEVNISAMVPANSNLVVEIALPDGNSAGNFFYLGVSQGGESKKGYIRSTPSGCNMTSPTALTTAGGLNQPTNAILLTVTGTK